MQTGQPLLDLEEKETWVNGHVTWASTTKLPLYDDEGRIVGTFGISRDITDQKETAEALRAAKEAAEAASRSRQRVPFHGPLRSSTRGQTGGRKRTACRDLRHAGADRRRQRHQPAHPGGDPPQLGDAARGRRRCSRGRRSRPPGTRKRVGESAVRPGQTPDGEEVVDWSRALGAVQGDRDLLRSVVEAFVEESPALMTAVRQAASRRDAETLRRAAHTLQGSVRSFGSEEAFEHARQLERLAEEGNLNNMEEVLSALEQEMACVTPVLIDYLRGSDAAGGS